MQSKRRRTTKESNTKESNTKESKKESKISIQSKWQSLINTSIWSLIMQFQNGKEAIRTACTCKSIARALRSFEFSASQWKDEQQNDITDVYMAMRLCHEQVHAIRLDGPLDFGILDRFIKNWFPRATALRSIDFDFDLVNACGLLNQTDSGFVSHLDLLKQFIEKVLSLPLICLEKITLLPKCGDRFLLDRSCWTSFIDRHRQMKQVVVGIRSEFAGHEFWFEKLGNLRHLEHRSLDDTDFLPVIKSIVKHNPELESLALLYYPWWSKVYLDFQRLDSENMGAYLDLLFKGCRSLKRLTLPACEGVIVTWLGADGRMSLVTDVDLPMHEFMLVDDQHCLSTCSHIATFLKHHPGSFDAAQPRWSLIQTLVISLATFCDVAFADPKTIIECIHLDILQHRNGDAERMKRAVQMHGCKRFKITLLCYSGDRYIASWFVFCFSWLFISQEFCVLQVCINNNANFTEHRLAQFN